MWINLKIVPNKCIISSVRVTFDSKESCISLRRNTAATDRAVKSESSSTADGLFCMSDLITKSNEKTKTVGTIKNQKRGRHSE